jgi:protein-S-isoprenylcysteine O-methyltransferase Ste14
MQRVALLVFGVVVYAIFFATFLYLVAFVGNLQATPLLQAVPMLVALVPHSIDAGGAYSPTALAVLVDLALILAFGLQHSVMARTGFKAWLKRRLPPAAERSVYVLFASLMLALLFWQWRPIATPLWQMQSVLGQAIGWSVFALGFGIVLLSTFLIDHFELFGLKQVLRNLLGHADPTPGFVTPFFYRLVRHPLYLGFILAFWSGPSMTVGHGLFAATMTAYILVAIRFEERDLVRQLGQSYEDYRQRVPMLVPGMPGAADTHLHRRTFDFPRTTD